MSFHNHQDKAPYHRFSMPEGWRHLDDDSNTNNNHPSASYASYVLGNNLASLGRMGMGLVVVDPQFDAERYCESDNVTRAAAAARRPLPFRTDTEIRHMGLPHSRLNSRAGSVTDLDLGDTPNEKKNPFVDSNDSSRVQTPLPQEKEAKQEKPYHVFSKKQTWFVVVIIGAAGLFSGLSSNIYFPSLAQIANELNVSLGTVSLTITSYLIVQGFTPVIWGAFSDALGRRPIYIASFAVYILSNIVLSFSPNFAVLMIFRGIQAAGSASTVSIGNGVIQDICPPATRGAYISFYQAIRNFSIAIGPVLGGLLAHYFGFRSVFVFLLILSVLVLFFIIFFLPETMRKIAGDGSLRLPGIYKPLIFRIKGEPAYMQDPAEEPPRKKVTIRTFIDPLKLLGRKEILLNLLFGGLVYAIWSMVTSSTTGLFADQFGLNETLIGLAYIPNGFGTIIGSAVIGHFMTRDFKAAESDYKTEHNLPEDYKLPAKNLPAEFPIEHARQRQLWWVTALFVITTGFYGWSLMPSSLITRPGWIAVPLALQFMIAATSNAVFAMNQTLISDMCPGKGASGTAINNLVRCSLGAIGVAVIDAMISSMGAGLAFLTLALVVVLCTPLVIATLVWGQKWRMARTVATANAA